MLKRFTGKMDTWKAAAIVGLIMMSFVSIGHAGKIENFTADQIVIDPSGNVQREGKFYVTPQKMRMDILAPQGPKDMVMIFRRDLKLQYMINTGKKIYVETVIDESEMEKATKQMVLGQNEKILGSETVSGYKCTKKQVDTTVEVMGYKTKTRSIVWIADQFEMPLRTQTEDGSVTEMRNIKKGRPAANVFEVPKGYQKSPDMMSFMAAVMGNGQFTPPPSGGTTGEQPALPFKLPKGLKLPK